MGEWALHPAARLCLRKVDTAVQPLLRKWGG